VLLSRFVGGDRTIRVNRALGSRAEVNVLKVSGYTFEGPFESADQLKDESGVYAVVTDDGGTWKLLDCGESVRMKDQVAGHERKASWEEHAVGKIAFVAKYCDERGRRMIASEIRQDYQLPCG
jgi:hypothetical protein